MEKPIRDLVKGSSIYFYHLAHPEDVFMQELMDSLVSKHVEFIFYVCYHRIIENDRFDIIRDINEHMSENELESLAIIAVQLGNKEIMELIFKNELNIYFYVFNDSEDIFLVYAYRKRGLEIIKLMGDTGFCLNEPDLFSFVFEPKDIDTLTYLIDITEKSFDELLTDILPYNFDMQFLIDFFVDKINIVNHKNDILLSCRYADDVKLFIESTGITIDSNEPLKRACQAQNIELIEFYLQYGLQVDAETLKLVLLSDYRCSRPVIDILLKYNVDLSLVNSDYKMDYNFIANLENHGLNKYIMLPYYFHQKN